MADFIDKMIGKLENFPMIRNTSDLSLIIPDASFNITDHGLAMDLPSLFADSHRDRLLYIHRDADIDSSLFANILIIFGHNDEKLFEFLHALGDKQILRDKLLWLITCFDLEQPQRIPNSNRALIQEFELFAITLFPYLVHYKIAEKLIVKAFEIIDLKDEPIELLDLQNEIISLMIDSEPKF